MKKITKSMFRLFHFFLITLVFYACSKEELISHPCVMDKADVLSQEELDSLNKLNVLGASMFIYTIDSMNIDDVNTKLTDIWDTIYIERGYKEKSILIVGSKTPNCAYIFYNDENPNIPLISNGYASREYFQIQINDTLSQNKKLFEMVRLAMNSYIANDNTINLIESELIGRLYSMSVPSYNWKNYKFIKYSQKLTRIFVNIFGFWLYVILFCVCFYTLSYYVSKYLKNKISLEKSLKYNFFIMILLKITPIILYILPIVLSVILYANTHYICGVEFAPNVMAIEGVPLDDVYSYYLSDMAKPSTFIGVLAASIFIFSIWDTLYFNEENMILFVLFGQVVYLSCVALPLGMNIIILIMALLKVPQAFQAINQIDGLSYLKYGFKLNESEKKEITRNHLIFLVYLFIACIFTSIIWLFFKNIPDFQMPIFN